LMPSFVHSLLLHAPAAEAEKKQAEETAAKAKEEKEKEAARAKEEKEKEAARKKKEKEEAAKKDEKSKEAKRVKRKVGDFVLNTGLNMLKRGLLNTLKK